MVTRDIVDVEFWVRVPVVTQNFKEKICKIWLYIKKLEMTKISKEDMEEYLLDREMTSIETFEFLQCL